MASSAVGTGNQRPETGRVLLLMILMVTPLTLRSRW